MITLIETTEDETMKNKQDSEDKNTTSESTISETLNNYFDFLFSN